MGYFVAVANQRLTQEEIRSHVTSEPGCGSGAPAIRHAVRIPHFEGDSGSSKRTKRMPKGASWRKGATPLRGIVVAAERCVIPARWGGGGPRSRPISFGYANSHRNLHTLERPARHAV